MVSLLMLLDRAASHLLSTSALQIYATRTLIAQQSEGYSSVQRLLR